MAVRKEYRDLTVGCLLYTSISVLFERFERDFDEPCTVWTNERGRLGKSAETDEGRFAEVL